MAKNKRERGLDLSKRPSREERDQERENVREYKRANREPYNPSNEVVVGTVGAVDVDPRGNVKLHVEYLRYKNEGPVRIRVQKRGKRANGTQFVTDNIGFMHPSVATALSSVLTTAVQHLAEMDNASA